MDRRPVLVAGGGIAGLSVALTMHQIGVPCVVLESVRHLEPLGVGINLQPNAVRELYELAIGPTSSVRSACRPGNSCSSA
jgi:2-polyprenyl-6-methoxyphenol hydroxylase-like FAD-dependent oxidoreductase